MGRFDVRSVAVLALGSMVLTNPSPAAATRCSDPVFEHAAIAALAQRNKAIREAYVENYRSAKADAFIAWRRTIDAPFPCNSHVQDVRTHLLRNLGALWLSYTARAAGDVAGGLALLATAANEAVLTKIAVANT